MDDEEETTGSESPSPIEAESDARVASGRLAESEAARRSVSLLGRAGILLVRLYQYTLSPLIGQQCRFRPTCSHYMIGAIERYGALRGIPRGLWRIARCHPWGGSGYDPP